MDAAEAIHSKFVAKVGKGKLPPRPVSVQPGDVGLAPEAMVELFYSQCLSRQLDRISRRLQARGEGFYTIGSSGHENNAAVAAALRPDDMAFLHYRSNAFQIHRSKQVDGQTPAWDMLLSFAASAEDPISGGRHKVIGSKPLSIPPQTSTIASHLPKAVGAAFSIGIARMLKLEETPLAPDSIVLASFGDASANHSTAQGAFNTAGWAAYQGTPMPLVFLCEDNGIGISTRTPGGWIEAQFHDRAGLRYVHCNGLDMVDAWRGARIAAHHARMKRKPVFLHMEMVRLYGHAGSDMQATYLSKAQIEADEERDPLLFSAALLVEQGLLAPKQILDIYNSTEADLDRIAEQAIRRPKLTTAKQVMASLIPPPAPRPAKANRPSPEEREALFARDAALMDKPQHMARLLSWALADLMLAHGNIIVAGEDVGPKGGVYNVTAKLHERFGSARVINTLLDEQSILGLGIGAAHNGLLAITEIQFLAYVHNAEDQIRGEAATLSFFSNGQYTNPMIIRIAGPRLSERVRRAFPQRQQPRRLPRHSRPDPRLPEQRRRCGRDAARVRTAGARGAEGDRLPRADRALHDPRPARGRRRPVDRALSGPRRGEADPGGRDRPPRRRHRPRHRHLRQRLLSVPPGREDPRARSTASNLRVIDLRWLAPLDEQALLDGVAGCARVLIVDECRRTGSQSEALMALFTERMPGTPVARLTAEDSFIPLGRAATLTLPSRDSIVAAALDLVGREADRG